MFIRSSQGVLQSFAAGEDEEVIWSPDSKGLLITFCLGAMGPCEAETSLDTYAGSRPLTEIVQTAFSAGRTNDPCYTEANVAGLSWEEGSKEVVLIAEVSPSPECPRDGGYFEGFVMSVPEGRITAHYTMVETVKRWRKILSRHLLEDRALVKENPHKNGK
jgi:hypothetical protein